MYYYAQNGRAYCALEGGLPLPAAQPPEPSAPVTVLFSREAERGRTSFVVSHPRQLTAAQEDVSWLDSRRMAGEAPTLPPELLERIENRTLRAVNLAHPRGLAAADVTAPQAGKKRLHLLAVGDVGGTMLIGLKLLGGDVLHTVGICDLDPKTTARWEFEMNQVALPGGFDGLPQVEVVEQAQLFDCDVFVFAASRGVPPVGQTQGDVRMAQFEANRTLVERYARMARDAGFRGLFAVVSDPVDPLCKAALLSSNRDEAGAYDGKGLLPEQIQGYGLGVMNARAGYFAKKDPRFAAYLTQGRAFGPHGEGLVIADSLVNYNDALSQELTDLTRTANLRLRELGFKPYVAPALSSAALSLLATVRGQWHYGSVYLGGVYFGAYNRYGPAGQETEDLALPDALYQRLLETQAALAAII